MPQRRLKRGRVMSGKQHDNRWFSHFNWAFFIPMLILCLFGLLMVYDASVAVSVSKTGNEFYYVNRQAFSLGLGLVLLVVLSFIDYHFWLKIAPYILLGGLALLFAVLIPGLGVELGGARSWLALGPLQFQPSYPLTIALIIYLARWITSGKLDIHSIKQGFLPYMAVVGSICFIVAVPQKDLGTAAIIAATCFSMYFLAGAALSHFALLAPLAGLAGAILVMYQPYRLQRITTFLQGGSNDLQNADYQITQLQIALGIGGWTGQGLGQSRQKYEWLPVVESDSIFAIIGEELGYLGSLVVLSVYFYLIWQGLKIASQAPDEQGRLLASGIICFLAIQCLVNLLAAVSIIPLTGVPLPFISSGGTSLLILLAALGIVLNISLQSHRQRSSYS